MTVAVTFQCEDITTVAQLIEPTDDFFTVDIKKRVPPHQNTYCLLSTGAT